MGEWRDFPYIPLKSITAIENIVSFFVRVLHSVDTFYTTAFENTPSPTRIV